MATTVKQTLAEDINELREMVASTYEELQVTLQSNDPPNKESAIKAAMATFNLAMGAALQKLNKIAEDPSIVTKEREEALPALSKLTWQLLRIAPFLGNPNQNILVARTTGAVIERLDFEPSLRSKEHCGFLFRNICNFLVFRQKSLANGESTDHVDAILQAFCPPLMVYFGKDLSLLDAFRRQEKEILESIKMFQRPITMIRRFLLQTVKETILLCWVEREGADGPAKITYAQRVEFTGLYVNKDLAAWAVSQTASLDSKFADAGAMIEMECWTALRDHEYGCKSDARPTKPHRIYQEGIPNDIASLDEEKIVLCYCEMVERPMAGKVFPVIDLEANKKGAPLEQVALDALNQKVKSSPMSIVEEALKYQLQRGPEKDLIEETLRRLKMMSMTTES